MTVFVYISRRPKVFNRPKKRLGPIVAPSNLSWKRALTRRWQPRRFLAKSFVQTGRTRLRYQPLAPPVSFAPTKHAFRIRIKRGKRFVKIPKLYSIAGPPVGFIAFKKPPRPKVKRNRRFTRPRTYSILAVPLLLFRKPPRLKIRRRLIRRLSRLNQPMDAPARFAPYVQERVLKLHSRPLLRFFRPRVALRVYVFPGGPIVQTVFEWIIRARRRGRR